MNLMFMGIGILLLVFSMIIFAIVIETNKIMSTRKRQILAKQRQYIEDTEMVLKYATSLSFSSRLIILLHERIVSALLTILSVEPNHEKIKYHINQHRSHISTAKITPPTGTFVVPLDERIAIDLARSISRLKGILRDELTKQNITLQDYLAEEQQLEQIRLKLRISNCLMKAEQLFQQERYDIIENILSDNIILLESMESKDEYLIDKLNNMTILLNKANFEISLIEDQKESEEEPTVTAETTVTTEPTKPTKPTEYLTSLDRLFDLKQDKKARY